MTSSLALLVLFTLALPLVPSGDGTTTRVVAKHPGLNGLIPRGTSVLVTVRHPSAGQTSADFAFER